MRNAWSTALLVASACGPTATPQPGPAPSASVAAATSASPGVAVAARAESRRDAAAVGEDLLASQRVDERRAVARALARIGGADAHKKLLRMLADGDDEALTLVAYGLGEACALDREGTTRALVARATGAPAGDDPTVAAFARALGRCGTHDGEAALAAWATSPDAPRARAACLALGDVAESRKLDDESIVALTKAAEQHAEALFPFSRTEHEGGVATRVRELATRQLSRPPSPSRVFAIRALGRTGPEGSARLGEVLVDAAFSAAERAEAARSLGRLGARGQEELARALPTLLPGPDPVSRTALVGASFGVLATAVESISHPPVAAAAPRLDALAKLPLDAAAPASLRRRITKLRCEAAARAAQDPGDPRVVGCSPDPTSDARELARLAVLARKPIRSRDRAAILDALARSPLARVRSAAFEVLGAHKEVDGARELVAWGLAHEHAGTVAAAAQVLAKRPELATASVRPARRAGGLDPQVELARALSREWAADDTETVAALASAAGALRLADARPRLVELCKSPWPALRAHAERALVALGDKDAACAPTPHARAAAELDAPRSRARVVLATDAGELALELDPTSAPTAVARFAELVAAGFYDGMAVHRVVPGFVVQLGDRAGDGTGGAGREPLRCETSPAPFDALSVGVALAGRDTGSSQLFVALSRVPHLDGRYALLGRATGDWGAVADGDVITKATLTAR